jgi:hypothetical protein
MRRATLNQRLYEDERIKLRAYFTLAPIPFCFIAILLTYSGNAQEVWVWMAVCVTALVTNQALLAKLKPRSKRVTTILNVITTFGTAIILAYCIFGILSFMAWLLS